MVVMATMSSGKSTLINALLGQQILPSRNEACTAKMYSILDDDQANETKIFVTYTNGEKYLVSVCEKDFERESSFNRIIITLQISMPKWYT